MPPARTPDQKAPRTVSPTGVGFHGPKTGRDPREQAGDRLTTPNGVRIPDSDHSLKAGPRGPVLLEDFHLREKIMHFDHERIPERVVHARGAGAHGVFTANPRTSRTESADPRDPATVENRTNTGTSAPGSARNCACVSSGIGFVTTNRP